MVGEKCKEMKKIFIMSFIALLIGATQANIVDQLE